MHFYWTTSLKRLIKLIKKPFLEWESIHHFTQNIFRIEPRALIEKRHRSPTTRPPGEASSVKPPTSSIPFFIITLLSSTHKASCPWILCLNKELYSTVYLYLQSFSRHIKSWSVPRTNLFLIHLGTLAWTAQQPSGWVDPDRSIFIRC